MRVGVMFPGDEFPVTTEGIDQWLALVAALGFDHVSFGDHVLGVDPVQASPGWDALWPNPTGAKPVYTVDQVFRDPFVLFGYIAAKFPVELTTAVLILPQRQAAVVAKQAAEVDLLSRGRLRLGVGTGWNVAEYEALGVDFRARGRIMDEQIDVMRALWTQRTITYHGEFHQLTGVGLQTLPCQRPIPVWVGGSSRRALERASRLGDGLMLPASEQPTEELTRTLHGVRRRADECRRDGAALGVEGRVTLSGRDDAELKELKRAWERVGASHLCLDTRYRGFSTIAEHMLALRAAAGIFR